MFNTFKKCLNTKSEFSQTDIDKVNDFVFCRWLSGDYRTLQCANMFNLYPNIPMECKLKFVQKYVNGNIKYIPYPKQLSANDNQDSLNAISMYFKISVDNAKLYLEFMKKEDIDHLIQLCKQNS